MFDRLYEQYPQMEIEHEMEITLQEIHGAERAFSPLKFLNRRSEIHWGLQEIMPLLDIPDDRELAMQLMSIRYEIRSSGQIQIIPKAKIKDKLGRSPDDAEALIYSFAKITRDFGFGILGED